LATSNREWWNEGGELRVGITVSPTPRLTLNGASTITSFINLTDYSHLEIFEIEDIVSTV
jgi:hypothetical protein